VFTRANALRQARRFEDAVAAYRQAIAVRPDAPFPYYGLSLSQMALGHADASASFSRCMQILPDPGWYHSRLHEAQRLGIDTFAVSDAVNFVKQAGWQNSSSPYVMYIAALAWMRKNLPDRATETLREIDAHVKADSWQAAIAAFLAGRLTPEAFLAKASPKELLTEAHAYIGIKASIQGDRERARRHLTWVKDKGLRNYTEYGLALGELERMESKPEGSRP
jgi:tetratricopeptide (TPR) repeat protein